MEPTKKLRTIDLKPEPGEILKPAETIDIVGTETLTLQDRRIINQLLEKAHGPGLADDDREFEIPLKVLRDTHTSNDRIEDSIERLMKVIVRYRNDAGRTVRFQLLGGNDMGEESRNHGYLSYSFDSRLVELLRHSTMFAKLEKEVIFAFQRKYSLALYEYVARRVRMKHVWMREHTVDEIREILGVPNNKLKAFGSLKQKAIDPALEEVNALAAFSVKMSAKRTGKRITHVMVSWCWKDPAGRRAAANELDRSKVGRKARIRGQSEGIVDADKAAAALLSDEIPI